VLEYWWTVNIAIMQAELAEVATPQL